MATRTRGTDPTRSADRVRPAGAPIRAPAACPPDVEAFQRHDHESLDAEDRSVLDKLTRRQREVVLLSSDGLSEKEIARRLGISEDTVGTHLTNAVRRLGIHRGRSELRHAVRDLQWQALQGNLFDYSGLWVFKLTGHADEASPGSPDSFGILGTTALKLDADATEFSLGDLHASRIVRHNESDACPDRFKAESLASLLACRCSVAVERRHPSSQTTTQAADTLSLQLDGGDEDAVGVGHLVFHHGTGLLRGDLLLAGGAVFGTREWSWIWHWGDRIRIQAARPALLADFRARCIAPLEKHRGKPSTEQGELSSDVLELFFACCEWMDAKHRAPA